MSNQLTTAHAVMEAGGSYNLHAKVQAVGGNLALPLLEEVVHKIILDNGPQPLVIADYGSSQGKNSFAPLRTAIRALRRRVGSERPIVVAHVDQPANDFNTLFSALDRDPDRYTSDEPNIFPSAIGRSFYEQVFPADHVHLGWSAYAAMWLSRIPTFISGHFRGDRGTAAECDAFRQQATQDWELFLSLRAKELRPGGRLMLVMVGMNDEGSTGFEALMDEANEVLANMVSEGVIRPEERARMVVGTSPRRMCDLLAPFDRDGQFQALTVESCQLQTLKDPTWAAFELDGNKEAMAMKRAKIFRATFAPSLACGLSDPATSGTFAGHLEKALIARLTNMSVPFDTFVQTMVLAKRDRKADSIEPKASVMGRQREIIVHGGSNVSPPEVEEVLYQHPSIFEAGVVGVPDPAYGERIVAFVSLRKGKAPGEQALRGFVRKHLADYKVPEQILFIREPPKGTTGKVHRLAPKAMLDEMSR